MRFVSFIQNETVQLGSLVSPGEQLVNLTATGLPDNLNTLIEQGDSAIQRAIESTKSAPLVPVSEIELIAPFPHPKRNIICVGKNYYEHSKEFEKSGFDSTSGGQTIPDAPVIFTKAQTSVIGPQKPIPASSDPTNSTDYEGELAVVISKRGYKVPPTEVFDYISGYTIVNDVTARNLQQLHKQWFLGKSLDGFCPMGPAFVTKDEINDPAKLIVSTWVNGELRQKASVKDLIFDIPTIIATVSNLLTILPGDIIATGTPAGVGIGFDPPKFLKPGDTVTVEIDPIGKLENSVV